MPFLKVAKRYGLFDPFKDDELKIHKEPIPYIGGIAMLIGIGVGLLVFLLQRTDFLFQGVAILVSLLFPFALGFWDDWKWKHISQRKPYRKFALLLFVPFVVTVILMNSGTSISFLEGVALSFLVTLGSIFVFMNAVNYEDGMDGLAGGFVAISAIGFLVLGLGQQNMLVVAACVALLGGTIGFLLYNFPPAKVFMGDSGAYMLGTFLVIPVALLSEPFHIVSLVGLMFIVGMPIADGVFTNIRRLVAGKSIFLGDRSHFFDRLLQKGFSPRKTLAISYALQILLVAVGVFMYKFVI